MLLLDEPFGALDARVRKDLRRWLRSFHEEMGITTVFVTDDQEEALELADEIVILNQGRIEQIGGPQKIYDEPGSPFICEFLGNVNRIGELARTPRRSTCVRTRSTCILSGTKVWRRRRTCAMSSPRAPLRDCICG